MATRNNKLGTESKGLYRKKSFRTPKGILVKYAQCNS